MHPTQRPPGRAGVPPIPRSRIVFGHGLGERQRMTSSGGGAGAGGGKRPGPGPAPWGVAGEDAESLLAQARTALFVMVGVIAVLWVIQIANWADHYQITVDY